MSLLIPRPKAPGKDIDVFLQLLIDELKELWEIGVDTRDAVNGEVCQMRAALLWTVNDFSAYVYMSGWSTKVYNGCPTCNEYAPSVKLNNKVGYIGHRRFLPGDHHMRRSKKFDGRNELRPCPRILTGEEILKQLEHVNVGLPGKHTKYGGQKRKRDPVELNWSRKSIFFELEYWLTLLLRHNLDVMHIEKIEKNICDSVVSILFNIDGKSKDMDKVRMDLAKMNVRHQLHPKMVSEKWVKLPAAYTMSASERNQFGEFLKSVKFPDGFAANISRNVNENDGKILGLKSNDCHVLLQCLLPVGIQPFLIKEVRETTHELCCFFQQICSRTLHVKDLEAMRGGIVVILCKLERIFLPAFFDVMVQLALHLKEN